MIKLQLKIISLAIISFALFPSVSLAAILYLEPVQGEYYQDDTFIQEIRLNTQGEYINTVRVDLRFDQDILEVKDFSQGNSVLTLWAEEPTFSNQNGTISFIAGVPAGYQGWDGLLGRIIFQVHETEAKQDTKLTRNLAKIEFLDSSQVLLNDRFGTLAELTFQGAILTILVEKRESPRDEWQEEIKGDILSPESFEIEVNQDPSLFEGKYFIIFSTNDKQTGIDYYQVKEGDRDWQKANSPYLLENQNLGTIIKVKAVDKAGNERVVWIKPAKIPKKITWRDVLLWIILGIIIVGVIWWIIRKLKIKSSK